MITVPVAPGTLVVSAGSGFARHLPDYLRRHKLAYIVTESAHPIVPRATALACDYGGYSARYGDIYTSRQLLQLVRRAYGRLAVAEDRWERDGRYFDPFRPTIQPRGFGSAREHDADRRQHLAAVRKAFGSASLIVVTLRDTTAWASRVDGAIYPVAPHQVLGARDADRYEEIELSAHDVVSDLTALLAELRERNAKVGLVLSVSPELRPEAGVRDRRSKAVLCAAMRDMARLAGVEYFPAYELLVADSSSADEIAISSSDAGLERALQAFVQWARGVHVAPVAAGGGEEGDRRAREDVAIAAHKQFLREAEALVRAACDDDPQDIKCVVWDLDDTLWNGVLLEDETVTVRPGIRDCLETLDRRGIVHSIASRNDPQAATVKLAELGLAEYFVHPQINWGSKAASVRRIAELLNIGSDAVAFIDDQSFERDEVSFALPGVMCVDAADVESLVDQPRLNPRFVTEDARGRRQLYVTEAQRRDAERAFTGSSEQFLATLDMVVSIGPVTADDLDRAEELTHRTHQLNSTGRRYSRAELDAFRTSPAHLFLISSLSDRYGPYGKVGLALVELGRDVWTIRLLLFSCRVMNRGVTLVLIRHVMNLAARAQVRLCAEFVAGDRNQPMRDAYVAAGFVAAEGADGTSMFLAPRLDVASLPPYVRVEHVTPNVLESLVQP